ncbi:hypothetical protein IHQ68_13875 [Chelatococcus sambhunathii]|uniref:Secreted protein n=1 Tax=Chelatococcus sambhunathii TaxID=363953 RepID=A0ABU1DHU6_9HYPH|nr:hypothetical protein [Chelatococcus sambhunathii]MDR4307707.1 hypothetical protein [Chelatococcus sambhunathii]
MRIALVLLALTATAGSAAFAQQLQQSVKYTLLVVAGGLSDSSRREGVAMSATGIYPGRQECEAAGAAIKYGVVNPSEGQPPPTITWVCVPLGKP